MRAAVRYVCRIWDGWYYKYGTSDWQQISLTHVHIIIVGVASGSVYTCTGAELIACTPGSSRF